MENDISVKGYLGVQESTDSQDSSETTYSEKNSTNIHFTVSREEDFPMAGEKESNFFLFCGVILLILVLVTMKKSRKKGS